MRVFRGVAAALETSTPQTWLNTQHHGKEYTEFIQARSAEKKSVLQQETLLETIQKREKLPPDSNKAKLDDQPLSVVENDGFWRLIEHLEPHYTLPNRHFISETAIPNKYKQVYELISECLENVAMVSFTTDISSSDVCPMSLLSLTAQWIDSSFYFAKSSAAG